MTRRTSGPGLESLKSNWAVDKRQDFGMSERESWSGIVSKDITIAVSKVVDGVPSFTAPACAAFSANLSSCLWTSCRAAGIRSLVDQGTGYRVQTSIDYLLTTYCILTFFTVFSQPENLARAQTVRTSPLSAFSYNSLSNISIVCFMKSPCA